MLAIRRNRFVFFTMLLAFGLAVLTLFLLSSQPIRDLNLPRIAPTVAPGLSREHHGELNKMGIPAARYDELRAEYEGNSAAQQQIDVYEYDPAIEYRKMLREYVNAFESNDKKRIAELEKWFKEHYPDIGR